VLAVVLVVGLIAARPLVGFTSDEGSVLVQARMLRDGQGWLYHSPLGALDPEGQARPFPRGDLGTKGVAPYAKHPLYPVLLAGLDLVGGNVGMLLGGLAATLVAAVAAAAIAARLDPRLDRAVLWLVGLASPLFFDSYLLLGHTLAAAGVGLAALAALAALRRGRSRQVRLAALAGMALALMVASMLRTEALFVGPAVAVGAIVVAVAGRVPVRRALAVAVAAVAASAAAYLSDKVWSHAIIGRALPVPGNVTPSTWLSARWEALHTTWFLAGYASAPTADRLLGLGCLALMVAALLLHWRKARSQWVVVLLVLACVGYVGRLLVGGAALVPGLALAFPAGWFLLWAAGRRVTEDVAAPLLAMAAAAVTIVVLITQYAIGGGVEWGGRYFAIVVPIAIPVLTFAAVPVIRRHGDDVARLVVAALVVVSASSSMLAVLTLRQGHRDTAAVLDAVAHEAARAGPSGGFDAPLVISSNRLLPQIDSRDFSHYVWVTPSQDELRRYGERAAARGVLHAVLVSDDQDGDLAQLPGWKVQESIPGLALDVSLLEYTGAG
jgi:hypothetical protein